MSLFGWNFVYLFRRKNYINRYDELCSQHKDFHLDLKKKVRSFPFQCIIFRLTFNYSFRLTEWQAHAKGAVAYHCRSGGDSRSKIRPYIAAAGLLDEGVSFEHDIPITNTTDFVIAVNASVWEDNYHNFAKLYLFLWLHQQCK